MLGVQENRKPSHEKSANKRLSIRIKWDGSEPRTRSLPFPLGGVSARSTGVGVVR